jgi:DNA-binding MarR family transcriptional regulator
VTKPEPLGLLTDVSAMTGTTSGGAGNAGLPNAVASRTEAPGAEGSVDGEAVSEPAAWTFRTLPSYRLHLLGGLSERHSEAVYRRLVGLKLLECRVLGVLHSFGRVSLKQLCQEANLDKSYASRLVNRLGDCGLIDKEGSLTDQRSVTLSLTAEGRRIHRLLHATAVTLNERWMSVLSPEQRGMFMTCLELLTGQLRRMAASENTAADTSQEPPEADEDEAEHPEPQGQIVLDAEAARRLHALLGVALARKS